MKNKKSLLALGLFALVLVLGVGYAVVANVTLSITGSAGTLTTDTDLAVTFTGEVAIEQGKEAFVNADATKATANGKTATIGVKDLSRIGDEVTVTYTIQNKESDIKANLATPTVQVTGDNAKYFTVTTAYPDDFTNLAANGTTTLAVTVKLNQTPTNAVTADINISLVASPVQQ